MLTLISNCSEKKVWKTDISLYACFNPRLWSYKLSVFLNN